MNRISDWQAGVVGCAMLRRAAWALGLSLILTTSLAGATFAQPAQVDPAAQSFHLGRLTITALRDAQNVIPNDGKVLGDEVGPDAVAQVLKAAGAPTDKVTLDVDALLVQSRDRVMLFDTGLGPKVHGALIGSLAKVGVAPADITDVFITHSHFDHVGGLATADGHSAFPHAAIHMSVKEWAWMQSGDNKALAAIVAPQVNTFSPGSQVAPGVTAVALYGHTPGHVGYEIASAGKRLLDMGDTAHSTIVSLERPQWAIGYDNDAKMGEAERRGTLGRLAISRQWVFAPHFPFPGVGKIAAIGDGFTWQPGLP